MTGNVKRAARRPKEDTLTLHGHELRLRPSMLTGSGGEAEIFDLGNDLALKRFKTPDHPDYAHSLLDRQAAAARLAEHQRKIPALLRLTLPERVAGPIAEVLDAQGAIAGYTMPLVKGAEVLLRYGDRPFREQGGVTMSAVTAILSDLHRTVARLHATGLVIGDFNDLNVLVRGAEAHLIDIDSAQFGGFTSTLFTARFLDPRLTDGRALAPVAPPDTDSDWFAFAIMAFRLLLLVDPFGGIHKPAKGQTVAQAARALERISVLHPDVRIPRQALPFAILPDTLLQRFAAIFEKDRRGEFPLDQLNSLRWTRCACGVEHARSQCPVCATAAPRAARTLQIIEGRITADEIFTTEGVLVAAALDGDRLLWLEHRDGTFRREDGSAVFAGPLDPRLTFALQRRATIVRRGEQVLTFGPHVTLPVRQSLLAINSRHRYWLDNDTLYRDGAFAPEAIGTILGGQTRFWAGETFGFGFYRASAWTVAFVFDAEGRGIRDDVALPRIDGQLIDADAIFTHDRCWLFLAMQENGRLRQRCTVIRRDGSIEASHEEEPEEGTWLARLHGNTAAGGFLLAATDEGIVRVEPDRGSLAVTAHFPDSAPFADATTRLFAAPSGVFAVSNTRIVRLTIGRS